MKHIPYFRIASITLSILACIFIAFRLFGVSAWSLMDYVVMGLLLWATGIGISAAAHYFPRRRFRLLAITVFIIAFLLIWAELAVGIFGTPLAGT